MAFTIDSISSDILTSSVLDYESSSPNLFKPTTQQQHNLFLAKREVYSARS